MATPVDMDTPTSILIIEDNLHMGEILAKGLSEAGFTCRHVATGREAEDFLEKDVPQLILLDLGLPDKDGAVLLDDIRRRHPNLPIIISSARTEVRERVHSLEHGADDYLIKPYAFEELLVRIRVQLRHASRTQLKRQIGPLTIDIEKNAVYLNADRLDLSPLEYSLIAYLSSQNGRTISRQTLKKALWHTDSPMTSMDNTLDVLISRVRKKITLPESSELIHTVRGVGVALKK